MERNTKEIGTCPGGCLRNYADPAPHCQGCTLRTSGSATPATEKAVLLSKCEMPWTSWQLICVKWGFDPFKTTDVLLYCNRAEANMMRDLCGEEGVKNGGLAPAT